MAVPTPTIYWPLESYRDLVYIDSSPSNASYELTQALGVVPFVAGYSGNALDFPNNINNYIVSNAPNNIVTAINTTAHTLSCWVNLENFLGSRLEIIHNGLRPSGASNANSSGSSLYISPAGVPAAAFITSGANASYTDSLGANYNSYQAFAVDDDALPTNEWVFLTATYGLNTVSLYVNGVKKVYATHPNNHNRITSGNTGFHLGVFNAVGGTRYYPFDGLIDEVKAWDSVLTDAQVLELYQSYVSPPVPSSMNIGVSSANHSVDTVHIKPINSISAINLSSTWSG